MMTRKDRLRKLVIVQQQLKALHETRRAGHLATAAAAHEEAEQLMGGDAEGSLSALFPDLYQRRISAALAREQMSLAKAQIEAVQVATATMRNTMVEKTYRTVSQKDDRDTADKERLERVDRTGPVERK